MHDATTQRGRSCDANVRSFEARRTLSSWPGSMALLAASAACGDGDTTPPVAAASQPTMPASQATGEVPLDTARLDGETSGGSGAADDPPAAIAATDPDIVLDHRRGVALTSSRFA